MTTTWPIILWVVCASTLWGCGIWLVNESLRKEREAIRERYRKIREANLNAGD